MLYLLLLPAFYVLLCAVLYLLQRRLLYAPTHDWIGTPAAAGLDYEDIWIQSGTDERIHGWYVPHPQARGAVLFCHGNGGNNSHRLDSLVLMRKLGLSVLIFDYPGYGQSSGKPSQASMIASGEAAREWLETRSGNEGLPLILWGRSLGGAVAALLARTRLPTLLIIESSFPDMASVAGRLYPYLPVQLLLADRWLAANALATITCPKLIVHSLDDDLVPFSLGQELFEESAAPKQMLTIHGNHEGGWFESGTAYTQPIEAFLDEKLGATPRIQ